MKRSSGVSPKRDFKTGKLLTLRIGSRLLKSMFRSSCSFSCSAWCCFHIFSRVVINGMLAVFDSGAAGCGASASSSTLFSKLAKGLSSSSLGSFDQSGFRPCLKASVPVAASSMTSCAALSQKISSGSMLISCELSRYGRLCTIGSVLRVKL